MRVRGLTRGWRALLLRRLGVSYAHLHAPLPSFLLGGRLFNAVGSPVVDTGNRADRLYPRGWEDCPADANGAATLFNARASTAAGTFAGGDTAGSPAGMTAA